MPEPVHMLNAVSVNLPFPASDLRQTITLFGQIFVNATEIRDMVKCERLWQEKSNFDN